MKKVYYLSSCSTCQRIIKELHLESKFEMQDIKVNLITPEQLDEMKNMAGNYEALFSRRAIKYKTLNLKDKKLSEDDYRRLILEEYTFLKRPVIIYEEEIFIGNTKKTIASLSSKLNS